MTRSRKLPGLYWLAAARRAGRKTARPPYRLRTPERLEDRTVPAVTLIPDGAGRFIAQFTEDAPATNDTLLLRVNNAGQLEYSLNGGAFTNDLNSSTPGVQAQLVANISRIDVLLDGGNDVLGVDGLTDPNVIPTPGGIVFAAGTGTDRLDVSHSQNMTLTPTALTVAGRTITFTELETARLTGGSGDQVLDATAFTGRVTLDGGNGKDTLLGGSNDDILDGTLGADLMDGGGGNDQLFSGNAGTTMIGGAGNDTLNGGNGPDQASGGDGDDLLFGGNGADNLDGGAGNDTFSGGPGNDTALGGPGIDRVLGIGDLDWTLTDGTLTGEGTDILSSIEQAQLTGGPRNNTLNAAGFSGQVTLQGGGGNDILIGGTGQNVFNRPVGETGNLNITGGPAGSTNDYFLWPQQGAIVLTSPGGFDSITFLSAVTFNLNLTDGTPQAVDGPGASVALNGIYEQCLGSDFDDKLTAASNTTVMGGAGKDILTADAKTNVFMAGGADADTLQQTGGTNIILSGDTGLDSLTSTGGTNITVNGGADADSLQQIGGTNIVLSGDSGLDVLTSTNGNTITLNGGADADTLQQAGGTAITMNGGADADTLLSSGGTNITMSGGADADTLQQTGGTNIILSGDEGLDHLTSIDGNTITLNGGADADTLQQTGGTAIVMSGGADADTLLSSGGTSITISGGADADTLQQTGGTSIILGGDEGLDHLTSLSGSQVTMSGGADADTLLQQGGTTIVMNGDGGLDSLTSQGGTNITINGGADADTLQQTGGTAIVMTGGADADSLLSSGGTIINMSGGADADTLVSTSSTQIVLAGDDGDDRLTVLGGSGETVAGGAGNDTYVLAGATLGPAVVNEVAGPAPDLSRDTLDFSGFTGGAINLNLAATGPQAVATGLTLTLTDGAGIENVIGTAGGDTVTGNGQDNLIIGADLLDAPAGAAPGWNGRTQVVYLDFDTFTDAGEHAYSQAERDAIQARLVADYVGPDPAHPWFHFQFTQAVPVSGPFARLNFNQPPATSEDSGQLTGGFAHELDFRNLNLGTGAADDSSRASIQVNGILGADGQPPDTTENWIALSEKIAAHELGHLVGLLHQDSYGPIGYGPHAPPGGASYHPDYTGPSAAFETFDHLMSSPASVGSNRFNDVRDLYFGEREAIKLAFAESGTVVLEQAAAHRSFDTAQPLSLAALAVPNTLAAGALDARKTFSVAAVDVAGPDAHGAAIVTDPGTGLSESDFYSFTGRKGDLMNIEVLSLQLTRLGSNIIDSMLRVYDAGHNLVAYYSAPAFNDDLDDTTSPHNIDAALVDLRLPADGTYYVEVDTFTDTDVGEYELFLTRFDAGNADDVGDVLDGQGGSDSLVGGLGNDALKGGAGSDALQGGAGNDTYVSPAAGADTVTEESGRDTLDFAASPVGITVNLGLDSGQVQTVAGAGNTAAITGTVEIVLGSAFADSITGNAADNVLNGGAGNDTVRGGSGNDILLGGAGNDTLDGEDNNDFLIGGLGSDVLQGSGGDDILIGGQTTYDSNQSALDGIMAEWTGAGTYAQRVAHVTGTPGGLNGTTYLVKGTTVLDDSKAGDTLTGGLGLDLFFGFTGDKVTDRQAPTELSL